MTCLILAGAPIALFLFLSFVIPLPIAEIFIVMAGIILAVYLTMHYTRIALMPDGLFIPLGVEVFSYFALWGFLGLLR